MEALVKSQALVLELGGFLATQGMEQDVGITGLIGNHYSIDRKSTANFLLGLGYYWEAVEKGSLQTSLGINAFYFAPTAVQGNITQEKMFTNLSYRYSTSHYPVYLAAKRVLKTNSFCDVTLDFGLGANIIQTYGYKENSLDNGVTIPDNSFSGTTRAAFSVTAGAGMLFNNVVGSLPLEVSYRFFYLGKSHLRPNNSQILDSLQTGNIYANALMVSLRI